MHADPLTDLHLVRSHRRLAARQLVTFRALARVALVKLLSAMRVVRLCY